MLGKFNCITVNYDRTQRNIYNKLTSPTLVGPPWTNLGAGTPGFTITRQLTIYVRDSHKKEGLTTKPALAQDCT